MDHTSLIAICTIEETTETAVMAVLLDGSAPDWVHLFPAGRFSARDGRGPWTLENAPEVIQATLRTVADGEPVIDYDHQTDFAAIQGVGGRAPAAGWMKELQARPDGIWARVEWTAAARKAIASKEKTCMEEFLKGLRAAVGLDSTTDKDRVLASVKDAAA